MIAISLVWLLAAAQAASAQEPLRFVEFVQFKPASALTQFAGATGSLITKSTGKEFRLRLTDVSVGGVGKNQELLTEVYSADLSLKSHALMDVVAGKPVRQMVRKTDKSLLDGKDADVFDFREFKDNNVTRTEPHVEFKVADFLSVILIAADAINRGVAQPIDLSMLRDRSVARATLTLLGEATVGQRKGTRVRVAPPDNPNGGITYVIARTNDGRYFPALISVPTPQGPADLEGVPQ